MHIHSRRWKTFVFSPKILVAFLPVIVAIVLSGSVALAGSVEDRTKVNEKAKLELVPMGVDPGATGEAELELRIEQGKMELRAKATAEGLTEDDVYSLCVENGFEDNNGAKAKGSKVDLSLEVDFETLLDVEVTIRRGADCSGTVALIGTVSESDLS